MNIDSLILKIIFDYTTSNHKNKISVFNTVSIVEVAEDLCICTVVNKEAWPNSIS